MPLINGHPDSTRKYSTIPILFEKIITKKEFEKKPFNDHAFILEDNYYKYCESSADGLM